MTSQNGWSVITSKDLDISPFPGTKIVPVPGIRKGDVATVLHYVGEQFNKNVEKLVNPGCWGYFNRPIRGSTQTSNHASGTAIDLNAPKHPLGAQGTFTASQKAEIRKILNYCNGVVRWGGDYSGRKDEMHFEIIGNATQVTNLAKKIKGATVEDMIGNENWVTLLFRQFLNKDPSDREKKDYAGKDVGYFLGKMKKANYTKLGELVKENSDLKEKLKNCGNPTSNDQAIKDSLFNKIRGIFGK